jgi:uncharacterized protein (TIGR00369 family)
MGLHTDGCFVCSPDNPAGLHLHFDVDGTASCAEFHLDSAFDGYPGVTHGGIQAAILDDAMANIFYKTGLPAFTVDIHVRYLHPMLSGRTYRVEAHVAEDHGSRIKIAQAHIIELATGEVTTEARATFFIGRGLLKTIRSEARDEFDKEEGACEAYSRAGVAEEVPGSQTDPAEHADRRHHPCGDDRSIAGGRGCGSQEGTDSQAGGDQVCAARNEHGDDQA